MADLVFDISEPWWRAEVGEWCVCVGCVYLDFYEPFWWYWKKILFFSKYHLEESSYGSAYFSCYELDNVWCDGDLNTPVR